MDSRGPRRWYTGADSKAITWLVVGVTFVIILRLGLYFWAGETENFLTDFDLLYHSAVNLTRGLNPYDHIPAHLHYELFYPLPAVIISVPFTVLPLPCARVAFDIATAAAFAYALWRARGSYALLALLSGAFIYTLRAGNTTLLVTAAALIPMWGFLLLVKPNTGLQLFLARPSRPAFIGVLILLAFSVILIPSWPLDWVAALRQQTGHIRPPIIRPFGFLLLLAGLRWRTAEGRLLLATAIIPAHSLPHELVPLALIPANRTEMTIYAVGTWLTVLWATSVQVNELGLPITVERTWPALLLMGYLPMLFLVLRTHPIPNTESGAQKKGERFVPFRISRN